jgi:hypothetical protein
MLTREQQDFVEQAAQLVKRIEAAESDEEAAAIFDEFERLNQTIHDKYGIDFGKEAMGMIQIARIKTPSGHC